MAISMNDMDHFQEGQKIYITSQGLPKHFRIVLILVPNNSLLSYKLSHALAQPSSLAPLAAHSA